MEVGFRPINNYFSRRQCLFSSGSISRARIRIPPRCESNPLRSRIVSTLNGMHFFLAPFLKPRAGTIPRSISTRQGSLYMARHGAHLRFAFDSIPAAYCISEKWSSCGANYDAIQGLYVDFRFRACYLSRQFCRRFGYWRLFRSCQLSLPTQR